MEQALPTAAPSQAQGIAEQPAAMPQQREQALLLVSGVWPGLRAHRLGLWSAVRRRGNVRLKEVQAMTAPLSPACATYSTCARVCKLLTWPSWVSLFQASASPAPLHSSPAPRQEEYGRDAPAPGPAAEPPRCRTYEPNITPGSLHTVKASQQGTPVPHAGLPTNAQG